MRDKKILYLFLGILLLENTYADNADFNKQFDQGIQAAHTFQDQPINTLKSLNMGDIIKNYTNHPSEIHYQNNMERLTSEAIAKSESDPIGKNINDSIKNRPQFAIKPNSLDIQAIQKQGEDAMAGVAHQFGDCTQKMSCTTTYETKTCQESPKNLSQFCQRTLTITLIPRQVVEHYTLTLHIDEPREYVGVTINTVDGELKFIQPRHKAHAYLVGRVPKDANCRSLSGKVTEKVEGLDGFSPPSCENNENLTVHVTRDHTIHHMDIPMEVTATRIVLDQKDSWTEGCTVYAENPLCVLKNETCIEPHSTHLIQAVSVTRDCWEKEAEYLCHAASDVKTKETCQSLRDQGCEQIGSVCESKTESGCAFYHQALRCPTKKCTTVGMICLGTTYCLNGDCIKSQKSVDADFQKSVSALSVVQDASKKLDNNNLIFSGKIQSCDNTILGAVTCCRNEGWLVNDLSLVKCTAEEKALGKAKEKGLTVYVGGYCDKDILGICTVHRKAYCIFPSKLARIIQEQGRQQQLHISFGEGEHPNCRGMSAEEFQALNFSQIDFSDFYADIAAKEHIEDPLVLRNRVKNKVQTRADREISHA
ncbi:MAG: hypothetical protein K0R24_337 [Gammaproteobacteria bacterium]|jgi:conjugal transfer mating pair stabilization protein TraN|nr:hypothetical protein [Gammaproteobacteria bacterium]